MSMEIEVRVLRRADGQVNGMSVVSGPEAYSEDFVSRLPRALASGDAQITIDGEEVVIEGPSYSGDKKQFRAKLESEEVEGLRANVLTEGKERVLKPAGIMTPGFQFTVKEA